MAIKFNRQTIFTAIREIGRLIARGELWRFIKRDPTTQQAKPEKCSIFLLLLCIAYRRSLLFRSMHYMSESRINKKSGLFLFVRRGRKKCKLENACRWRCRRTLINFHKKFEEFRVQFFSCCVGVRSQSMLKHLQFFFIRLLEIQSNSLR